MRVFRCPSCRLPLARTEADLQRCPVCGRELAQATPRRARGPARPPAPAQTEAARGDRATFRSGWAVLIVGLAAGATLLYMIRPRSASPSPDRQASHQATASSPGTDMAAKVQPATAPAGAPPPPGLATPTAGGDQRPHLLAAIEAPRLEEIKRGFGVGAPAPAGPPVKNVVLESSRQGYVVEPMTGSERINLSGRAARLEIKGLDGQAQLDVSNLQAREIRISGDLGGNSVLRLHTPYCSLTVAGNIGGNARVEIDSFGGSVRFGYNNPIAGSARVTIAARSIRISRIDDHADVRVIVSRGGALRTGYVQGSSRLRWRKAEADDPKPEVYTGKVAGAAKVEQE